MVEIKEVTNKWQLYEFVRFGNELYKDCPNFCPHLIMDELGTFDVKKNPAHEVCDQVHYLAYRDGKIVGRVCGIINHAANEKWGVKHVRFGWIDFIDDLEVSKALLDAVAAWGKSKGMDALNGPVGFTDWDYEGLLIEGFEYLAPMVSLYNYPYYERHLEAYGLQKEVDWIEFLINTPEQITERMERVRKIAMERSKVRVVKFKNSKELISQYGYQYMDVLDEAYQKLYNFQPLTEKQKRYFCDQYFPLLNFDFVGLVVNEQNEVISVGVGMPNIAEAVKKTKGRLFPFGWYHLLKALRAKKFDSFCLMLFAIRPDYQGKGLNTLLMFDFLEHLHEYGCTKIETTSMLETNNLIQSSFNVFDHEQHKRRRAYIKAI